MQHFISQTKLSRENMAFLVLDNHALGYVLRGSDERARASILVLAIGVFCFPAWQQLASSKMASLTARDLFLLEKKKCVKI
jgi:hypothetical protein